MDLYQQERKRWGKAGRMMGEAMGAHGLDSHDEALRNAEDCF